MSTTVITTNVKIDENDYEAFRILMLKRRKKIGEAIGELISKEVRDNIDDICTSEEGRSA